MRYFHLICVLSAAAALHSAGQAPFYKDKTQLLAYLDGQGNSHPVVTLGDWQVRRSHILESMQQVMGPLPAADSSPLDLKIESTEQIGTIRRLKASFRAEGEDRVPAYLLIPRLRPGTKAPAVLCLHQTIPPTWWIQYHYRGRKMRESSKSINRTVAVNLLHKRLGEGAGFMLSNLLIRDTPQPVPLHRNPEAHPLIQFLQARKQAFWDDLVVNSFGNRILCGLRYFNPRKKHPPWRLLVQEGKLLRFYWDQLDADVLKLEQGLLALASGMRRFGFKPLDREQSFAALYELINFQKAPAYRRDLALNAQLAHSHYLFRPSEASSSTTGSIARSSG